jgi:hypothetical protein
VAVAGAVGERTPGGLAVDVGGAPLAGVEDGALGLAADALVGGPGSISGGVAESRGLAGAEALSGAGGVELAVGAARVGNGAAVHSGGRVGTRDVGEATLAGCAARLRACVGVAGAGGAEAHPAGRPV